VGLYLYSLYMPSFSGQEQLYLFTPPPPNHTILCGWEGVQSLGNPLANGTTALIQKENMEHGEKCTQSLPHTRASASLSTTNFILTGLEVKPALLCIQRQ
jgi:hypothetical protein